MVRQFKVSFNWQSLQKKLEETAEEEQEQEQKSNRVREQEREKETELAYNVQNTKIQSWKTKKNWVYEISKWDYAGFWGTKITSSIYIHTYIEYMYIYTHIMAFNSILLIAFSNSTRCVCLCAVVVDVDVVVHPPRR